MAIDYVDEGASPRYHKLISEKLRESLRLAQAERIILYLPQRLELYPAYQYKATGWVRYSNILDLL